MFTRQQMETAHLKQNCGAQARAALACLCSGRRGGSPPEGGIPPRVRSTGGSGQRAPTGRVFQGGSLRSRTFPGGLGPCEPPRSASPQPGRSPNLPQVLSFSRGSLPRVSRALFNWLRVLGSLIGGLWWGPSGLLPGGGGRVGVPPARPPAAFCLGGKADLGLIMVTHVAGMQGAGVSCSPLTLLGQEPLRGEEQPQPRAETPQTNP